MEDDEFIARKELIKKALDECDDPNLIDLMNLIYTMIVCLLQE